MNEQKETPIMNDIRDQTETHVDKTIKKPRKKQIDTNIEIKQSKRIKLIHTKNISENKNEIDDKTIKITKQKMKTKTKTKTKITPNKTDTKKSKIKVKIEMEPEIKSEPVIKIKKEKKLKTNIKKEKLSEINASNESSIPSNNISNPNEKLEIKTITKSKKLTIDLPTILPERIPYNDKYIGVHISAAGGVQNALHNAVTIGCRAFAFDTKSKRKWFSPPLSQENISEFHNAMKIYNYSSDHILPHGSYLMNVGSPDDEIRKKSIDCLVEEMTRCAQLGLK
jgi:hypothetical protein